ncbi:DUF6671 family protein [Mycobacterium sp.]|uniref:DUF6671 family protein n=1 Tax=Mycobacterium sp. TaxID=1785 RepID=UPI0031E21C27
MSEPQPDDTASAAPIRRRYAGAVIAMGTMHGKERQVGPAFEEILGARVIAPGGLDTDRFGTFTGDVERTMTPTQAATAKARLAMQATGLPYGLASEATYATRYAVVRVHEEVLVFLDDRRGIHVVEGHNDLDVPGPPCVVSSVEQAIDAARALSFPEQGLAVKTVGDGAVRVFGKGLTDVDSLHAAVAGALGCADGGQVWVEPDLRAHHNPTRRRALTRLARSLAQRLATPCPSCQGPGFGKVGVETGLRCRICGTATDLVAADILGCPACERRQRVPRPDAEADPRWCECCNC